MIELTPAVVLSFIAVLAVLGTKIWTLGAKVEAAATRDELNMREASLRKEFEAGLKDKSKESLEAHANLAHKSGLTRLEGEMFELEKELRNDVKELRESMDAKFEKSHQSHTVIVDLLTKINHYVTPRGK